MEREILILSDVALKGLPLFFRKIYFNELSDINEEYKLMKYHPLVQSQYMRSAFPGRQISKTINLKMLKSEKDDTQR